MTNKTFWAGFVDGKLYKGDPSSEGFKMAPLACFFTRRKDAKLYFDDVRKVEIREITKGK